MCVSPHLSRCQCHDNHRNISTVTLWLWDDDRILRMRLRWSRQLAPGEAGDNGGMMVWFC